MRSLDFTQLIKECTRITNTSETLIDLIFVNNEHRFVKSGVILSSISDHSLVFCILKVGVTKAKPRIIEFRSYKSYNANTFIEDLNNVPWHVVQNEDNVDDAILTWNKLFLEVADSHAPIKRRRVKGIHPPWMTQAISEGMRSRDYHNDKAIKTRSSYHWHMFKQQRNYVNNEIKTSKSNYYVRQIEESKGGGNKVWKAVNEAASRKCKSSNPTCIVSDGVHYTTPKSIATVLNEYFVQIGQFLADKLPTSSAAQTLQGSFANCSQFKLSLIDELFIAKQLRSLKTNKSIGLDKISARLLKNACPAIVPSLTYLLNMSIQSHSFPFIWKCARVVALFKSGDRSKATNYRPICILPTLSKILERGSPYPTLSIFK